MSAEMSIETAAAKWASIGLHVFPYVARAKVPFAESHGHLDASDDPEEVVRLFHHYTETTGQVAGIGVATGASGISTIDCDNEDAGREFRRLVGDDALKTLTMRTRRGWQFIYRVPPGVTLPNGRARLRGTEGLDHRSGSTWAAFPPSKVKTLDDEYRFIGHDLRDVFARFWELASEMPERVVDLIVNPDGDTPGRGATTEGRLRSFINDGVLKIPTGARNDGLYAVSGYLRHLGMSAPAIRAALAAVNEHDCEEPLPAAELDGIVKSIAKKEPGTLPGAEPWSEPLPLGAVPTGPAFPVEALPEWVRAYCAAWAAASQTPVDAAAVLALGPLATIAQGRLSVRLLPDWSEPAMLHVMLVMESGMKKSPTFKAIFSPIMTGEVLLGERRRADHKHALADLSVVEKRAEAAKKKAANATGESRHETESDYHSAIDDLDAAKKRAKETEPPRFFSDNVTPEALGVMLERHGRFTIASAEGDWWSMFAGRYSEKGGLQSDPLTKGWSGERITIDRKGAEEIIISEARLTMVVANQRRVLDEIEKTPGARDKGVLGRILKSAPPTMRGYRNVTDPPSIPPEVRSEYQDRMQALLLALVDHEPTEVALSPDAAAAFTRLRERHEAESRPGGRVHDLGGWAEKWLGQVARIALLLHLADADPADLEPALLREISVGTLEAAIMIGDYFTEHEIALAAEMREPEALRGARALLDWIGKTRPVEVEVREALRAKSGTVALKDAEKVVAALKYLQDHGHVRPVPVPKGKTTPRWQVNPAAYDPDNIDKRDAESGVVKVVKVEEGDAAA